MSAVSEASSILVISEPDTARQSFKIQNSIREFQHAIGAPDRCPFPIIAAVHGPVVGLGIDIISACDIRYAASNASFSIKVHVLLNTLLASDILCYPGS